MQPTAPSLLSYESTVKRAPLPHPLLAIVLALPGSICWLTFLSLFANFLAPFSWLARLKFPFFTGNSFLLLWLTAIVAALFSVAWYWRKPKPWYVILCLLVNDTGLLFTLAVLAIGVAHSFLH